MPLAIEPPLLNSANPWATDLEDLQKLYASASTGAVTTRTSLLGGFAHDNRFHQYVFFADGASLNTLGYSPIPLDGYLGFIKQISDSFAKPASKPFIISVTGSVDEVIQCYRRILEAQRDVTMPLYMEINLSCPNIPDKPPPAYDAMSLGEYISALAAEQWSATQTLGSESTKQSINHSVERQNPQILTGIKTPPYTYSGQFDTLINALCSAQAHAHACPISFITATNTLGNSLVLAQDSASSSFAPACTSYDTSGIGGAAGSVLHPLALGNVLQLTKRLGERPYTQHVQVIGVGGVSDSDGYRRMRHVGATAVGVGTALGQKGVDIFDEIARGLGNKW